MPPQRGNEVLMGLDSWVQSHYIFSSPQYSFTHPAANLQTSVFLHRPLQHRTHLQHPTFTTLHSKPTYIAISPHYLLTNLNTTDWISSLHQYIHLHKLPSYHPKEPHHFKTRPLAPWTHSFKLLYPSPLELTLQTKQPGRPSHHLTSHSITNTTQRQIQPATNRP